MSNVLAVFGATGHQGGSVIKHVLQDPELSAKYKIRAITRDVGSDKAKQLNARIEVVQADALDRASLDAALTGVDTVFAVTIPTFGPDGFQEEYGSAKAIADAAVAQGAGYIIFSTLPSISELSGGKYNASVHFEAKAQAERYIRSLPVKSAFFSPGFFMSNFENFPFVRPQKAADGTFVMARHNSPAARYPLIDAAGDTGKFVGAILAEPDRYEGETFCASTALYSHEEVAAAISEATGETVVYRQISREAFRDSLPFGKDIFPESFSYPEEFGYYGADTEKLVAWAAANARNKPSTLQEYLKANPLRLA